MLLRLWFLLVTTSHASEKLYFLGQFFVHYLNASTSLRILNVGSNSVTSGSYRSIGSPHWQWTGVDLESSSYVDVVLDDPYKYPFKDDEFDVVVCNSVMEHMEFFWLAFLEMCRVARSWVFLDVPTSGPYHAYPHDYWRFRDDAPHSLARWANRNGRDVSVAFSSIMDVPIWYGGGRYLPLIMIFSMQSHYTGPAPIIDKDFSPAYVRRHARPCWGGIGSIAIEMCCTGMPYCFPNPAGWSYEECCTPGPGTRMMRKGRRYLVEIDENSKTIFPGTG